MGKSELLPFAANEIAGWCSILNPDADKVEKNIPLPKYAQ
jgi:hypothetical protein